MHLKIRAIETIRRKRREKDQFEMKTASVIRGRFSIDQIYAINVPKEKRVRGDTKHLKIQWPKILYMCKEKGTLVYC